MTSEHDYVDGSNGYSASKPIHFFRIMLPESLLDGKLRIPTKFVRKYEQYLPNKMFLKLPNGGEWKINLEKRDDGVWFGKGWKEFAEYHSLAYGHLLLFRFDRTSHFHVLICDMSSMEIDYPFNKVGLNSSEFQQSKNQKTSGNIIEDENISDLQDKASHQTAIEPKDCLKNLSDKKSNIDHHTGKSASSIADEDISNTSFSVTLKSNPLRSLCMKLSNWSLKGNTKSGGQNVTLVVEDNRSWRLKLIHYPKKSASYFSAGWSAFARENGLKAGDTCLFKLLSNNSRDEKMVIKVSISRSTSVKTKVGDSTY